MPALPAATALTLICRADQTFHWTRDLTPWASELAAAGSAIRMWMTWDDGTSYTWLSGAAPAINNAAVEFDGTSNVATFVAPQTSMQSHAGNARWACRIELSNGAAQVVMGGTAIWSASTLLASLPAMTGVDGIADTVFVLGEATMPLVPMPPDAASAISAARAAADMASVLAEQVAQESQTVAASLVTVTTAETVVTESAATVAIDAANAGTAATSAVAAAAAIEVPLLQIATAVADMANRFLPLGA